MNQKLKASERRKALNTTDAYDFFSGYNAGYQARSREVSQKDFYAGVEVGMDIMRKIWKLPKE